MLDQVDPGTAAGPLEALVSQAPLWATVRATSRNEIRLTATVSRAGGIPSHTYELLVRINEQGAIAVIEAPESRLLPEFCPQRHINHNGTFCLGFGSNIPDDAAKVALFWQRLELFLRAQETASTSRRWPPRAEMSHGPLAATVQMRAEEVAIELGEAEALDDAIQENSGWIVAALRSVERKEKKRLLNGRAFCLCGRTHRDRCRKLRRQCRRDGDGCLVLLEYIRREAEKQFWADFKGEKCCGTMVDCPLA